MNAELERNAALSVFDEKKREYIAKGMTADEADEQAYRDIKAAIWNAPPKQR